LSVVQSTTEEIWSPKDTGKSEADIMLAIHRTKKDLTNVQDYRHVYVHQDTKKTKEKTRNVGKGINIDCGIEQLTAKYSDQKWRI
jgi:hypothetical protein